jgi:hypothetical protein
MQHGPIIRINGKPPTLTPMGELLTVFKLLLVDISGKLLALGMI